MGQKSRFLNLSYLRNTIAIKTWAFVQKVNKGAYPYTYFRNKVQDVTTSLEYTLNFQNHYHSLGYLNNQTAERLHAGERSITQELIVGLVYYNELLENKRLPTKYLFDLALKLQKKAYLDGCKMIFYFDESYARFDLSGSYYSGIVQGKAASFFLRCYEISKDEKYKQWAKKCLLSCWIKIEEKGILRTLLNGHHWVEEYPSPNPSMVLNGYLFYIIGLAEYLAFENDKEIKTHMQECLKSVVAWMPKYKSKNGLLYSMYRWNLCNVHYTGIMKYQFEHLCDH